MKIGLFFGSFNPIHVGHLIIANTMATTTDLEQVWFVVSPQNPFKKNNSLLHEFDRFDLVQRAISDNTLLRANDIEFHMPKPSYTIDTLRQLDEELPDAVLFFLMGADAVADVPHWREPTEILALATPLVVRRAGEPAPDMAALKLLCADHKQPRLIEMPPVEASSSEVRRRIAAGQSITDLVPSAIAEYIAQHNLYR